MVMISVMLHVLVFALCIGAGIAVLIFVPLAIYTMPYCLWVGTQNLTGKHMDKKKESVRQATKNATKLYKAKLTRREPTF